MRKRKLVLVSVAPGSEDRVAEMLAAALGVPREFADQIVGSAPIVLLEGLPPERAAAALEAVGPIRRAGAKIVVTEKRPPDAAELNWPSPPRLGGPPSPQAPSLPWPGEPSLN